MMANLYTKTGDKGETGLVGGSRISKTDLKVECYGTVDELGAALGFARTLTDNEYIEKCIKHIQGRLFSFAAEIASDENGLKKLSHLIDEADTKYLEDIVDKCTEVTGVQTSFVIPGENKASAAMHVARTIVRRGERNLLRLSQQQAVRAELLRYINRLSDAAYALARLEETLYQREELIKKIEKEVRRQMGMLNIEGELTLEKCKEMALRSEEKARQLGIAVVFAAVDKGGNAILVQRMENAYLGSIDLALNKAFSAVAFQMETYELAKAAAVNGPLHGIQNSNDGKIVIFAGGVPYTHNGEIAGAVGVSGGTVEEDRAIAYYALGKEIQED